MKKSEAVLKQSVEKANETNQLFIRGDHIGIACSGGIDSLALLHVFHAFRHEWGIRISAFHFHHHTAPHNDCASECVRDTAERLGIPFNQGEREKSQTQGRLSEEILREARYGWFFEMWKTRQFDLLAVAHHLNDQVETFFLRIFRGTGLEGARCMLPRTCLRGMPVIRPFLGVPGTTVKQYCEDHDIQFVDDPTNSDTQFLRNRIRHDLIPELESRFDPSVLEHVGNLCETAGEDYQFLAEAAKSVLSKWRASEDDHGCLSVDKLSRQPPSIQRQILRAFIREETPGLRHISKIQMDALISLIHHKPRNGQTEISGGVIIIKENNLIRVRK